MRKKLAIVLILIFAFALTACGANADNVADTDNNSNISADADVTPVTETPAEEITARSVIEANTKENIFKTCKSVVINERDYAQDKESGDYYSEEINCKTSRDYFYFMSKDLVVGCDPDDNRYGIIEDENSFQGVYDSYMAFDRTDYLSMELTLNGDNSITAIGDYEDYAIVFDPVTLRFMSVTVKNKDGSDWLLWTYEYNDNSRDDELRVAAMEKIKEVSDGETVKLTVKDGSKESSYDVPKGFAVNIYSENYYKIDATDEYYYDQPLNEDTTLVAETDVE